MKTILATLALALLAAIWAQLAVAQYSANAPCKACPCDGPIILNHPFREKDTVDLVAIQTKMCAAVKH